MAKDLISASSSFTLHRRTDDDWEVWEDEEIASPHTPREPLLRGLSCNDATRICRALNAFTGVPVIPGHERQQLMRRLWRLKQEENAILNPNGPR